jgi:hypothetical protein
MKPKKQRHPKSTAAEIEKRIETCEMLIARRVTKTQIHAAMLQKFNIGWRQADRYAARARDRLMKRAGRSKDELRCESLALYESVIQSSNARTQDRIAAQREIDDLYGLKAPKCQKVTGDEQAPVHVAVQGTILELPSKRALGEQPDNGNSNQRTAGTTDGLS